MNNKKRLTLVLLAMSGFAVASDTSSVDYSQQTGNVISNVYQLCNKENLQHLGTIIAAKALEAKDAVAAKATFASSAMSNAYQACNKENAQAVAQYVQEQAQEHPWVAGAIIATPFLTYLGYEVYKDSQLTGMERLVKNTINYNTHLSPIQIRILIMEFYKFDNQPVEVQQKILNALDKFVK